ncbi:hypothetical protein AAVH_11326 [Aphelenchoides avenae]|nr:hypothetical protein AAVH_11326 [Aphelenchus avenae]
MRSNNKRAAVTTNDVAVTKRPKKTVVPEEVTALLKIVASSIGTAANGFMNLPCADTAARGRLVAILADAERLINHQLGIKRKVSVLAVDDVIIDVLKCTSRKELDMLQLVSQRFNAIILSKMVLLCLRQLRRAKLVHHPLGKNFSLVFDEDESFRVTKNHRFPVGIDDETIATTALLNACRSSKLECLELYCVRDTVPLDTAFFDNLAQCAPAILLKTFCNGSRKVAARVPHDSVLQALKAFAELGSVKITTAMKNPCPSAVCFDKSDEGAVVKNTLMEFCFGECDDQYATRDRSLRAQAPTLERDFLKEWIERAEIVTCRHKLTVHVTCVLPQELSDIDVVKRQGEGYAENKVYFEGTRGRRWAAAYNTTYMTLELTINH